MQRILLRAAKDPFRVSSARQTLDENLIGTNSGNLLFSTAAARLLSARGVEVLPERFNVTPEGAHEINERYDRFVVPLVSWRGFGVPLCAHAGSPPSHVPVP